MAHTLETYDDEGDLVHIPARWAICERCRGEGTHGNEAFDGLSLNDEIFEDPDFLPDLRRGFYDVSCEPCHGSGKVLEPDPDACSERELGWYESQQREIAELEAMEAAERAFGC